MHTELYVFGALEVVGLVCLWHLWFRKHATPLRKTGWSMVVLVPLFGPLAYYSLFPPPSVQPELLRAQRTASDYFGEGSTHGGTHH